MKQKKDFSRGLNWRAHFPPHLPKYKKTRPKGCSTVEFKKLDPEGFLWGLYVPRGMRERAREYMNLKAPELLSKTTL